MNFTDYYSRILSIQGDYPKLSFEQHKKMFNIISLEMRLEEIIRTENLLHNPELQRLLFQRNRSLRSQLEKLTDNDHAASLLEKMVETSQRD